MSCATYSRGDVIVNLRTLLRGLEEARQTILEARSHKIAAPTEEKVRYDSTEKCASNGASALRKDLLKIVRATKKGDFDDAMKIAWQVFGF
jgi:hypothetical protein